MFTLNIKTSVYSEHKDNINKTKESLNSNGQQFHQYQQNKESLNSDSHQFHQYQQNKESLNSNGQQFQQYQQKNA